MQNVYWKDNFNNTGINKWDLNVRDSFFKFIFNFILNFIEMHISTS